MLMRHGYLLLPLLLVMACASSKETAKDPLSKAEPYIFVYNGTEEEAINSIKQSLLPYGIRTDEHDKESKIWNSKFIRLKDDERIDMMAISYITGISTQSQEGRISILYQDTGGAVTLKVYFYIGFVMKDITGLQTGAEYAEEVMPHQNNPFPLKYGRLLSEIPRMVRLEPVKLPRK